MNPNFKCLCIYGIYLYYCKARRAQQFLGGIGLIHEYPAQNKVYYSISSNKELNKLITHFENYPLLTQKAADFLLFKEAVILMNNKAHLTIEGLKKIINIKASVNLGLSDFLKSEFKEYTPVKRPVISTENIPDPNWEAGRAKRSKWRRMF